MVIADGNGVAIGRPQDDLGVDECAVAVLVDVHHRGSGLIGLSGRDGSVHGPLLAHPEVAECVLEAAAGKAAVDRGQGHGRGDGDAKWLVIVPVGVDLQAFEIVV